MLHFFNKVSHRMTGTHEDAVQKYCLTIRSMKKNYTSAGLFFVDKWSPLRYAGIYVKNINGICIVLINVSVD